jgi:hypothetical protein
LSGTAAWGQPGDSWRESPAFLRLFAPVGVRAVAYRAYVSKLDLDAVLQQLANDVSLVRTPGAWAPRVLLPADAFGQAGAYDRSRIARLYGGRPPRVARGSRREDGRVTEMWTLISPYPDPSLEDLQRGTLLLVLRLP